MVNKRIVLGILLIAFVGIAAAGTWANFVVSAEDTGTLKAGTIAINLDTPVENGFSMDKLIPDSTTDHITYHRCHHPSGNYFVTVRNNGDIPASLFISDALASSTTIADHMTLYYSTTETGTPIEITEDSLDTGLNVIANGNQRVWLWYSYENIDDDEAQTLEMGDTVNAVITFELKNPDTSDAGDSI